MKSKYTNKNGVKLLAAMMAFAMVLVAGFVVLNDEGSDAAPMTSLNVVSLTGTPDDAGFYDVPVSEKGYYISENTKVKFQETASINAIIVKFYVKSGVTLTVDNDVETNLTIEIYAVSSGPVNNVIGPENIAAVNAEVEVQGVFEFESSVVKKGVVAVSSSPAQNGEGSIKVTVVGDSPSLIDVGSAKWAMKVTNDEKKSVHLY